MFKFCSRQKKQGFKEISNRIRFTFFKDHWWCLDYRRERILSFTTEVTCCWGWGFRSDDFSSLGTCSAISGHQSSFAYHSLIGVKRFLVCILVRLPARWLGAETEAKVYPAMQGGFCCCAVLFCYLMLYSWYIMFIVYYIHIDGILYL